MDRTVLFSGASQHPASRPEVTTVAKDEGEDFQFEDLDQPEDGDGLDLPGGEDMPDLPGEEDFGPGEPAEDFGPGEFDEEGLPGGDEMLSPDEIMPAEDEMGVAAEGAEEEMDFGDAGAVGLPDFGPPGTEPEEEEEEEVEAGPKKDYSAKIMLGILAGLLVGLAVTFAGGPLGMPYAYYVGPGLIGACLLALFVYSNYLMIARDMGSPYIVMLELSLLAILVAIAVFWKELSDYKYDFQAKDAEQRVTWAPAVQPDPPSTTTAA
jgi:hypothetical protein